MTKSTRTAVTFLAGTVLVLWVALSAAAQERVVRWEGSPVDVTDRPGSGEVVGRLATGDLLSVVEVDGTDRLVVLPDGTTGWIRHLKGERLLAPVKRREALEKGLVVEPHADRVLAKTWARDRRAHETAMRTSVQSDLAILVSLDGLTVHATAPGFDRVYPCGVGVLGRSGRSITPTCVVKGVEAFQLHWDPSEPWYYQSRRTNPSYFGGFPFLRMDIDNGRGEHTYGFHGPISRRSDGNWFLKRGYVSHGCIRMRQDDVQELFDLARRHPGATVRIQEERERDAQGLVVDVDYPRYSGPHEEDN